MIVTTMREVTLKVEFKVPQATELEKLEKKSLVTFIYVGKPTAEFRKKLGNESRIQLNDSYAEVAAILKVRNKKLLKGSTIYVGRTFKSGHNAIARPCPACMQAIIDHGIKEIVYTTDDGLAVEVVILDDK
jgi:hypothetical protein